MLVVHELAENVKLLPQELIGKINLRGKKKQQTIELKSERKTHQSLQDRLDPHRGVHDACAVGPDGVGDVTDVDGVQVLVVTRLLDENL